MADHNELGKRGEILACSFLKEKGYSILQTNWRRGKLEIDIIALDGDELVFIEVKTRASSLFGEPENAVTPQKRRHLIQAANAYVIKSHYDKGSRFDVISIIIEKNQVTIHHIPDAFYPI
jgi:putative endonuclease